MKIDGVINIIRARRLDEIRLAKTGLALVTRIPDRTLTLTNLPAFL